MLYLAGGNCNIGKLEKKSWGNYLAFTELDDSDYDENEIIVEYFCIGIEQDL